MAEANVKAVEAYIARAPEPQRSTLLRMREHLRAAAPDLEEGISYAMPALLLNGSGLVCYSHFKDHCSFFPMSAAVMEGMAGDLSAYKLAKGTIRFPVDKPMPAALIKRIVKLRRAEVEAKKAGAKKKPAKAK